MLAVAHICSRKMRFSKLNSAEINWNTNSENYSFLTDANSKMAAAWIEKVSSFLLYKLQ